MKAMSTSWAGASMMSDRCTSNSRSGQRVGHRTEESRIAEVVQGRGVRTTTTDGGLGLLAPPPPVRFITPKAVRGSLPRPTERVEERVVGRFSGMAGEVGGDCTDHVREHGGGLAAPGKQHVLELDLQWAARKVVDVRAVLTSGAMGVVVHRDGDHQRRFHSGKSSARTW